MRIMLGPVKCYEQKNIDLYVQERLRELAQLEVEGSEIVLVLESEH